MSKNRDQRNEYIRFLYRRHIFLPPGGDFRQSASELGIQNDIMEKDILPNLTSRGLIEMGALGGDYYLTIGGIDEVEDMLNDTAEVRRTRTNRISFLSELQRVRNNGGGYSNRYDIGNGLQLDNDTVDHLIVHYYHSIGFIERTLGPEIRITEYGNRFLEGLNQE